MGVANWTRNKINRFLASGATTISMSHKQAWDRLRWLDNYYKGNHPSHIKVRPGAPDDNLTLNFLETAISRSVALLVGTPPTFIVEAEKELTASEDNAEPERPLTEFIDHIWEVSKKGILLNECATFGGIYGRQFMKIVPADTEASGLDSEIRLITLNPEHFADGVVTDPEDKDRVLRYVQRFPVGGKWRKVEYINQDTQWQITHHERDGDKWIKIREDVVWPYPFAPIVHWNNLTFGRSDIESAIPIQNRMNQVAGNFSKIVRLFAQPHDYVTGGGRFGEKITWGGDEMMTLENKDAKIGRLELNSDLAATGRFWETLRDTLLGMTQTVDMSAMVANVGNLTNFGLTILFYDALSKLSVKQTLWNDALGDLNRRLLFIATGDEHKVTNEWGVSIPTDKEGQANVLRQDVAADILSRQTARTKRGYDVGEEQLILDDPLREGGFGNLGESLLSDFESNVPESEIATGDTTALQSEVSFTGIQVTKAIELVEKVRAGFPYDSAVSILMTMFAFSKDQAVEILGPRSEAGTSPAAAVVEDAFNA